MRFFHHATDEEIKSGLTTDIYFSRTKQIIEAKNLDKLNALAEVTSGKLPGDWPWGVLCGVEEIAHLFEGVPVDVYAMPEGSVFYSTDCRGVREPVMFVVSATHVPLTISAGAGPPLTWVFCVAHPAPKNKIAIAAANIFNRISFLLYNWLISASL